MITFHVYMCMYNQSNSINNYGGAFVELVLINKTRLRCTAHLMS